METIALHQAPVSGKGSLITVWTLSGLTALAFLAAGGAKLAGAPAMVAVFEAVGIGQWFRYLTGALEVVGAIGLLLPKYAFYAATLLTIVMVGAVLTHIALLGGSPLPAAVLLILSATIAWLRKA